jgi:hypothetical protein
MDGAQRTLLPFRQNTRQKQAVVNNAITYSLGGRGFVTLPPIGYLSKIFVRFNGSVTYSAGSTAAKFAPYSIFNNIRLDLNGNKHILCDVSGFQLFLYNSLRRKNGRLDQNTDADNYVYPVAAGPLPLVFTLEIPVAVSDGQNFMNGLINLQAPELQCNLSIQFLSALTDLGTNITALSGTVDIVYEYYEVPDPSQVMQPYTGLHKILSQIDTIAGTGENKMTVPRGGKLMRMFHVLELNGARSDAWDTKELRLNNSQQVYYVPRWCGKHQARQLYGFYLPTGVIVWDFVNAWGIPEESDQRDILNTEIVTTTESRIVVTAGTTLGSNNNFLHTVREIFQVPQ